MRVKDLEQFITYFEGHRDNPSMVARLTEIFNELQDEYNSLLVKATAQPEDAAPMRLFSSEKENLIWEKIKALHAEQGLVKY